MTCDACARAKVNPLTGRLNSGCIECSGRSLAQEPQFFESVGAEAITNPYRDRLQQIFGSGWKEGREAVKAWAARIDAAKKSGRA